MPTVHLTPREQQVLRYVSMGSSNKDIADELHISEQAVKALVSRLLLKYGVRNRTSLVARAREVKKETSEDTVTMLDALARSRDLRDQNRVLMDRLRGELRAFRQVRAKMERRQSGARRANGLSRTPSPQPPRSA